MPITAERFRRLALALPDAVEGAHQGHPDFRAHGRVFASLHPDGERGMVRVAPATQRELLARHPEVFSPASGAWGRAGCTMLRLGAASVALTRAALAEAWQAAAATQALRRTTRAATPAASARPRRPRR